MNNITVIIPAYNSAAVIVPCLSSIPDDIRVIVVDNDSSDNTVELARNCKAEVVKNKSNLGFGRACNIGIERVVTPFFLLLNPDAVLSKDSIQHMLIAAMRYPDSGIIAPVLYFENGDYQNSFRGSMFAKKRFSAISKKRIKAIAPEGDLCADFVSGACMLIRAEIIKRIGAFDENIFMFYEDDDLCLRMRANGYSCIVAGNARVLHVRGASSAYSADSERIKNYHVSRSCIYMQRKYKGCAAAYFSGMKMIIKHSFKAMFAGVMFNKRKMTRELGRIRGVVGGKCWN